jgi:hypothetical protein
MRQRLTLLLTCSIRSCRCGAPGWPGLAPGQPTAWLSSARDLTGERRPGSPDPATTPATGGRGWPRDAQIMGTAAVGVAEKEDDEERIDRHFDRVIFFSRHNTPSVRRSRGRRSAVRAVMGKRGDAGVMADTRSMEADLRQRATTEATPRDARPCQGRQGAAGASLRGRMRQQRG